MTEHLSTLMRHASEQITVPPADAARVLAQARRLRVRRRLIGVTAGLAAAAAVAGLAMLPLGDSQRAQDPAPAAALTGWAVGAGSTVHLGNGSVAEVEGTVKSVYYTSAGVLVRTGRRSATDAPDSSYWLLDEAGRTTDFSLDLGDRVPGTDPEQPYLAYAEASADPHRWRVVVRDVRTGEVAHEALVRGSFTWGGWVAPPVSLSGEHVYVGLDGRTAAVEWRTGRVERAPLPASTVPTVARGRSVVEDDSRSRGRVVGAADGRTLLGPVDLREAGLDLAPDGRHAVVRPYLMCEDSGGCAFEAPRARVYDVATGAHVEVDVEGASGLGWTPDGWLLRVDDDSVDVCDPGSGECLTTPVEVSGDVRVGGSSYES